MNVENYNKVLAQIETHPNTWNQRKWHCRTSHCFFGWAQVLSGKKANIDTVIQDARLFLQVSSFEAEYLSHPSRTLKDFQEYSSAGYNRAGYDRDGYDRAGYNRAGYDRDGYDRDGYDRAGYDCDGYERAGYNLAGYNRAGYDRAGYDRAGYDRDGLKLVNREWITK